MKRKYIIAILHYNCNSGLENTITKCNCWFYLGTSHPHTRLTLKQFKEYSK